MGDTRRSRWASSAGAVVGLAVTAVLVVAGPLRPPARVERVDAAPEFLDAWARSRRGTFVVRARYERRQPGGATLTTPTELVQRPPDRLVRRFDGVSGELGGRPVLCTAELATDAPRCTTDVGDGPPPPYDEQVAAELEAFRGWFRPPAPGARPLYRVVRAAGRSPGCFDLVRVVPYPDAPYGTDARLCFDGPTGALASLQRRFDGGIIETETAEHIEPAVTDADLVLPG